MSPEEHAIQCERVAVRIRQRPPSRRNQLILAALRLRAMRLRKLSDAAVAHPKTPSRPLVFDTYNPPVPYRVFRLLSNPDAATTERRLPSAALRLVKENS